MANQVATAPRRTVPVAPVATRTLIRYATLHPRCTASWGICPVCPYRSGESRVIIRATPPGRNAADSTPGTADELAWACGVGTASEPGHPTSHIRSTGTSFGTSVAHIACAPGGNLPVLPGMDVRCACYVGCGP